MCIVWLNLWNQVGPYSLPNLPKLCTFFLRAKLCTIF
jgi:hypothetical protein